MLQNNALRAVKKVDNRYSATQLHIDLDIEWLDTTRKRITCGEVYKLINGKGPAALTSLFEPIAEARVLRSNKRIKLNRPRTKSFFADKDFVIRGMNYWDALPEDIQHAPSSESFKLRLKKNPHVFEHIT